MPSHALSTTDFLDRILPGHGRRCVGVLHNGVFKNIFKPNNLEAAEVARQLDARGLDVYIACAGYGPLNKRKQINTTALGSHYADIDTREGKPDAAYADRQEAAGQVVKFCRDLRLKMAMIVNSGYGLHVYWVYDEDISPAEWKHTATLLKLACRKWGLAVDPARTCDEASVLRIVGTRNRKHGAAVTVDVMEIGEITTHAEFRAALVAYLGGDPGAAEPGVSVNSDLSAGLTYAPSDAHKIADACAVVAEMRDTGGCVEEPVWYSVLSILARTVQGNDIAHAWSSGYSGYTYEETQHKIERSLTFGPATCEKLEEFRPQACAVCKHKNRIKSPITLGAASVKAPSISYPEGYGYDILPGHTQPVLYYTVYKQGEDGRKTGERQKLADYNLYATARIANAENLYSMALKMADKRGQETEFVIDSGKIAEGGSKLFAELGRHEVNVPGKLRNPMQDYLNAWIGKLREDHAKTPSADQFGWHEDGFVLGNTFITPADERRATLTQYSSLMGTHIERKGDLQTWVDTVDIAYNRPGSEPLQYCVLMGFAAPLWSLFGDNGGITVYAMSADTGVGKTTAQSVGLSAWGRADELILREGNFTANGLYQHLGVAKNLPVVIDEFTNSSAEFASNLAYNVSAGKGKTRLRADSSNMKTMNWSTIVMASGNRGMAEKLQQHRANASAEMSRVWEFTVNNNSTITPNEALSIFPVFKQHYGHAGYEFIKYVVKNRDTVQRLLFSTRKMLNEELNLRQGERYWSALHACAITALVICRKLKLLKFDLDLMLRWISRELVANRRQINHSVKTPIELFGDMLLDLSGGIIATHKMGNVRTGDYAIPQRHVYGPVTGRIVAPEQGTNEQEVMWISMLAAQKWASERGVSFNTMFKALVESGVIEPTPRHVLLGRGTLAYSGSAAPVRSMVVNLPVLRAVAPAHVVCGPIMQPIKGIDDARPANTTSR